MKRIVVIVCGMLLVAASAKAQDAAEQVGTLTVLIKSLESNEGQTRVALFDSEAGYNDMEGEPFRTLNGTIAERESTVVFEDVPFGMYAVVMYHDANGNDKFDKNFLGIPKEDYAFSNNARGTLSAPPYDDVKFELAEAALTIEIVVPGNEKE